MGVPDAPQRRRRQRVPRRQQLPVVPGDWLLGLLQGLRFKPPLLLGVQGVPVFENPRLLGPLAGLLGPAPPSCFLLLVSLRLRGLAPLRAGGLGLETVRGSIILADGLGEIGPEVGNLVRDLLLEP